MKDRLARLEPYKTFGDLLKYLRNRAQLTQKDLAVAVGYSEAQISRLENGKRSPDMEVVHALFVPALGLEDEPETVTRLLALAKMAPETGAPVQTVHTETQGSLPAELSSLVGREADLAEIARLLALPDSRLLTLTGAGGCGKSRLALRAGRNLAGNFPHGAWWVELVSLSDPLTVPQALVSALGLANSPNHSPVDILTAFLRERWLLLILDNCEHLVEAVARLAAGLLSSCPKLQILATSREPLGAPGEILYRVPSLALPPDDSSASVESYAAGRLFLERAASIQPGFRLAEGEGQAVARICRRLDGIPLAIELAAGRANVLSLSQLANRLEEGFHVLGSGGRSLLPRHATLRATVDWSYNLLPKPEQVLLRRLALFSGSWTLEQAEEICAADELEQEEVLERLAGLVNKSLVLAERLPDSSAANHEVLYRLHEMVRQYAFEKLAESGEEEDLRQRFLNCFIYLAEKAEAGLKSLRQLEWLAILDQNAANLVHALNLAATNRNALALLRLSGALDYYWLLHDLPLESMRWLETALTMRITQQAGREWLRARAKVLLCFVQYRYLSYPTALDFQEIIRECEQIYQTLGNRHGLMVLLIYTIEVDHLNIPPADIDRLRAQLPELIDAGEHWIAARALFLIGAWERSRGNITAGDLLRKEALVQAKIAGDIQYQAFIMQWLAWTAWDQGNVRQALEILKEAVCTATKVGKPLLKAKGLLYQAVVGFTLGNYEQGYAAIDEAITIYQTRGAYWRMCEIVLDLGLLYILEGRLAEARQVIEKEMVIKYVEEYPNSYRAGIYYETLGKLLMYEGQVDLAADVLVKAFDIPDRMNEHVDMHQTLRGMGQVRLAQGNLPAAHELLHRALAEITRNRTLPDFPETLDVLAQLALAEGQPTQAARLLGASDGLLKRMEMVRYPIFRPEYEHCRETACCAQGEADFTAAYTAGEAIAVGQNPIEEIQSLMDCY